MNIKKKNPQEATREDFNDVEVFLNREDNQFYYLDRYRQPVRLVPESLATDKNNQILEIGGEGDELTLRNGSLNGTPVPDSVIPMEQIAQGFRLQDVSDVDPYSGNADKFLKVNASGNDVEWVDAPTAGGYTYTEVAISSAQILSLGSTPVELLPQPGDGSSKYYYFSKIIIEYTYNTTAYSMANNLQFDTPYTPIHPSIITKNENSFVIYKDFELIQLPAPFTLEGADQTVRKAQGVADYDFPFSLTTGNSVNPTLGDGTLLVKIWYKVKTFGTEL